MECGTHIRTEPDQVSLTHADRGLISCATITGLQNVIYLRALVTQKIVVGSFITTHKFLVCNFSFRVSKTLGEI